MSRPPFQPVAVVDVEVAGGVEDVVGLRGFTRADCVVRVFGVPVGRLVAPVWGDRCPAEDLVRRINGELGWEVARRVLIDALLSGADLSGGVRLPPQRPQRTDRPSLPSVTVAICTRDRPEDLRRCLRAVRQLDLPVEVLVVDNAPRDDSAATVVAEFAGVRHVVEPRPGLDWARNRAVLEAGGDVIAFTDDDVVVDPGWARAIAEAFAEDAAVMAVTGLVVPAELDTEAQAQFERTGGFDRGYRRQWVRADTTRAAPDASAHLGSSRYGTGANMAFRRAVFAQVGLFDPALDVGTASGGGGDSEMLYRVIAAGHTLLYDPAAMVRHRHRRTYAELRRQLAANGAFLCHVQAAMAREPHLRGAAVGVLRWLARHHGRRLVEAALVPGRGPVDLVWAEIAGHVDVVARRRYGRARREAAVIVAQHGPQPRLAEAPVAVTGSGSRVAVATVDLDGPLPGLATADAWRVRAFARRNQVVIGEITVAAEHRDVSAGRLAEALVDQLQVDVVPGDPALTVAARRQVAWAGTTRLVSARRELSRSADAADGPVSIVIATRDRPEDLRRCLSSVGALATRRCVDVVVVDNNPASGLTRPVVAEFPGIRLVEEARPGLSYARNTGLAAARYDLVALTDDDTVVDPRWVDELAAPFARNDVAAVTGNVLPVELETGSQQDFETVARLGRGFGPIEAGPEWCRQGLRALPTWELGAGANLALRRSAVDAVGGFDEALGAGTPTGCSEDSYLLYRLVLAGHTVLYEPAAVVWHRHRATEAALRTQIGNYYRGHVAHHLAALAHEKDVRAALHVGWVLPRWLAGEARASWGGQNDKPRWFWRTATRGALGGPLAYAQAERGVRRRAAEHPQAPQAPVRLSPDLPGDGAAAVPLEVSSS